MSVSDLMLEWLQRADNDLRIAKHALEEFPDDAAFHSQQAAEKALKAVMLKESGGVIKTHELVFLARKAKAPREIIECCESLSQFFVATRYPGYTEAISEEQANKAIKAAQRVVSWSKEKI